MGLVISATLLLPPKTLFSLFFVLSFAFDTGRNPKPSLEQDDGKVFHAGRKMCALCLYTTESVVSPKESEQPSFFFSMFSLLPD